MKQPHCLRAARNSAPERAVELYTHIRKSAPQTQKEISPCGSTSLEVTARRYLAKVEGPRNSRANRGRLVCALFLWLGIGSQRRVIVLAVDLLQERDELRIGAQLVKARVIFQIE